MVANNDGHFGGRTAIENAEMVTRIVNAKKDGMKILTRQEANVSRTVTPSSDQVALLEQLLVSD